MTFKEESRYHKFFPLVKICTTSYEKSSSRHVEKSTRFDSKWYAPPLPMLYARQIAKLQNAKRLKVELPYSIYNLYDTDKIEAVYNHHRIIEKPIKKNTSTITGEEILEEELMQ